MRFTKNPGLLAIAVTLSFFCSQTVAEPEQGCGDLPSAPEIIQGIDASLEELIANSKSVNAFIEKADQYLDCQAVFNKKTKKLPESVQEQLTALLNHRNEIGDEFNAQVAAYREANPEP